MGIIIKEIQKELRRYADKNKAQILQRFFKTGKGEYGQDDIFLGVVVPDIRKISKHYKNISFADTSILLKSRIHEERLLALLILVLRYSESNDHDKKKIYQAYLKNTRHINNWDLIDLTAYHIVGAFLEDKDKHPLYNLANSKSIWEKRISILSTFHYIKHGKFSETLRIAKILLRDEHDLIHKAVGWMLREVGKRDLQAEERFLKKHYKEMPRTMLRYAIEKFPESKRQAYLKGKV